MMWRLQSLASLTALLLLAKRNVVLGGVLLLAVLLAANGIHILTRGESVRDSLSCRSLARFSLTHHDSPLLRSTLPWQQGWRCWCGSWAWRDLSD
jgi:hypothetical protein